MHVCVDKVFLLLLLHVNKIIQINIFCGCLTLPGWLAADICPTRYQKYPHGEMPGVQAGAATASSMPSSLQNPNEKLICVVVVVALAKFKKAGVIIFFCPFIFFFLF